MYSRVLLTLAAVCIIQKANCETRVAVAHLVSNTVSGSVTFTEVEGGVQVTGALTGLAAGQYGFHIHELGDITTCDSTGAHFNPDEVNHGGRDHDERHVGDLGNVAFTGSGLVSAAALNFVDHKISLRGRNNVLGRAVVLHAQEDDLGEGGHELSLTTGNAGARVACGVIAIRSPADPWNAATSKLPIFTLSFITVVALFLVL